MSLLAEFRRVSRARPCPVCGRQKYCLLDRANAEDPARVICTKLESQRRWGEAGWLHVLRDDGARRAGPITRTISIAITSGRFPALAEQFRAAMTAERLARLATGLGLSEQSLERLGAGVVSAAELESIGTKCRSAGCWTFPMRNGEGAVVGIRLRTPSGFKYAVTGGKQGLFLPTGLDAADQLLIAEGPTDAAALLDLGFAAVGRPSCDGGVRHIVALVRRVRPRSVVVVADGDEPGLRGAAALAGALSAYVPDARWIRPPDQVKDAREWKRLGATRDDVLSLIEAAAPRRLMVRAVALTPGARHGRG